MAPEPNVVLEYLKWKVCCCWNSANQVTAFFLGSHGAR